ACWIVKHNLRRVLRFQDRGKASGVLGIGSTCSAAIQTSSTKSSLDANNSEVERFDVHFELWRLGPRQAESDVQHSGDEGEVLLVLGDDDGAKVPRRCSNQNVIEETALGQASAIY